MHELIPGEYETTLNGVRIHYTIRGSGPALIAISGGPGMDARGWDDFARIPMLTKAEVRQSGARMISAGFDVSKLAKPRRVDTRASPSRFDSRRK